MRSSKETFSKSTVGFFAVAVVAAAVAYTLYNGKRADENSFVKIFDEVGRVPDVAGAIDQWQVSGDSVTTFIETSPNQFKRLVLVLDKDTKYREAATPDVAERTLHEGEFEGLRVSRMVEIYLKDPPYSEEKRNVVDAVIYW